MSKKAETLLQELEESVLTCLEEHINEEIIKHRVTNVIEDFKYLKSLIKKGNNHE